MHPHDRVTHGASSAFVYPFLRICESILASATSDSILTGFFVDDLTYPHFEIYPGNPIALKKVFNQELDLWVNASNSYPTFNLCAPSLFFLEKVVIYGCCRSGCVSL